MFSGRRNVMHGVVSDKLALYARGISRCRKCRLHRTRNHAVPGEGDPHSGIVIIGEAPGATEDRTARPFMGPSGKFFEQLLNEHGVRRQDIFLTSCVKCRPPGNRNPRCDELACCVANWLQPQLEVIKPAIVVLAGLVATQQFLPGPVHLAELHGTRHRIQGRVYFVTYHPAAAMRFPAVALAMRADFAKLSAEYFRQFFSPGRSNHPAAEP